MSSPDDEIDRRMRLAMYEDHDRRRRDRWARAGALAAWCLVALGVFSGVVLLLTLVTR